MRLLSYNIHKGIGGRDRRYQLDRIVDVIQAEHPDIVCLQEVDHSVRRSKYHNQPELLAERCSMKHQAYQLNVPIRLGGYGNLVMSRWPIREVEHLCLRFKRCKPRGAQLLVVETRQGPLCLVNWHLGLRSGERLWQAGKLLKHAVMERFGQLPTVIAGDSNDWRNHLSHRVLTHHEFQLATSPPSRFRSFPAYWPMMALDKIYYRGPLSVRNTRLVINPLTRHASDHLPLLMEFGLPAQTQHLAESG